MTAVREASAKRTAARLNIHASCVAIDGAGVLLRGPSGSGKSDLTLRLIDGGAMLVADDRVDLCRDGDRLVAAPPPALAGLVEAVGIGPLEVPHRPDIVVGLIIDLVPADTVERLPRSSEETLLGVALPRFSLHAFGISTPAKVRLLARGSRIVMEPRTR